MSHFKNSPPAGPFALRLFEPLPSIPRSWRRHRISSNRRAFLAKPLGRKRQSPRRPIMGRDENFVYVACRRTARKRATAIERHKNIVSNFSLAPLENAHFYDDFEAIVVLLLPLFI
ncbi:MAG TPA: hypothetical protein VFE47_14960 [Tepidisphaeraceae bacterium]|jgi:hypothetical protein|nr:hypothetical protein [Tepidisphaeraceae bacterium]